MTELAPGTACIGVLITIPDPVAAELAPWRDRFVDPALQGVPPHITLLPPTLVPVDHLDEVEHHLRSAVAATGPFSVHLRGSGTFLPVSPVTFVQVATGIGPCELLEARIRSGPLARPLQFPYHPHVTVAHNVDVAVLDQVDTDLACFDARFDVRSVDLYEAAPGWALRTAFALPAEPGARPAAAGAAGVTPATRPPSAPTRPSGRRTEPGWRARVAGAVEPGWRAEPAAPSGG